MYCINIDGAESQLDMNQVVDGGSAIIGDAYEWRDTIHADHLNMVKFSDRTDDGYSKVLYAIKVLLRVTLHSSMLIVINVGRL